MNEVLEALNPTNGVTVASVTVEDEYFPPPPELREMLKTLSALLDLSLQYTGYVAIEMRVRPTNALFECGNEPREPEGRAPGD